MATTNNTETIYSSNTAQIIWRKVGEPTTSRLGQGVVANTILGLTNQDLSHVCGFKFNLDLKVDLNFGELTAARQLATAFDRGVKEGKKGVADAVRDEMQKAIKLLRTAINAIVEAIGLDPSGTLSISFSVAKNLLREVNQYMSDAADALEYVGKLVGIAQGIQDLIKWLSNLPENIRKTVQACLKGFQNSVQQIAKDVNALPHQIESSVKSQFSSLSNSLTQSLNTVKNDLTESTKNQNTTLNNILNGDSSSKTLSDLADLLKPPSKEETLKEVTKTTLQRP